MLHGLVNVHKEAGMTSHDVVARLRKILRIKKIGHTGTLDPEATGVLVAALGDATKLTTLLLDHQKEYIAVCRLGVVTDTEDLTGQIVQTGDVSVTSKELHRTVQGFKGTYEQVPPMYSAIRVNGKRMYALAREGKQVERTPRRVTIEAIRILDESRLEECGEFTFEVRCSKGTYIRTLCADIGEALGCGGCMAHLTRTAVGAFHLSDAYTLSDIEEMVQNGTFAEKALLPPEAFFRDYDMIHTTEPFDKHLHNGNPLSPSTLLEYDEHETSPYEDGLRVRAYDHAGNFWAICKYDARKDRFLTEYFFHHEPRE